MTENVNTEFIEEKRSWINDEMTLEFLRWALRFNPPDRSGTPIALCAGDVGLSIAWEAWKCSKANERASAISMAETVELELDGSDRSAQWGASDVVKALKGEIRW